MITRNRIQDVVRRSRAFYQAAAPGHFLLAIYLPHEWTPIPDFTSVGWDDPRELHRVLDAQLENHRALWRVREGLDDDTLPCIAPRFGYAEHTAWLGMRIRWQKDTSLGEPFLTSEKQIDALDLQEDSFGYRLMRDSYAYLRGKQQGDFFLAVRGNASPMELANAVRGDEIFSDFIEEPEFCHRLIRRLASIYPKYLNRLRSWADEIDGGHLFWQHHGWIGPNAMGHFSNDAAMLCGPDIYAEFGFPYEEEMMAQWDHALFHIHTAQMHYVPQLAKLSRLRLLQVTEDPGTGTNFAAINRILAQTGKANLLITTNSKELREKLDTVRDRNAFFVATCENREDAEDLIAWIRDQSA